MNTLAPTAEYTAPEREWAVLAALSATPDPAQAIADGGWSADYFVSTDAVVAYERLRTAHTPMQIEVPAEFADTVPAADLGSARALLTDWHLTRVVSDLQHHLASQLREVRAKGTPLPADVAQAAIDALDLHTRMGARESRAAQVTLGQLAASFWDLVSTRNQAIPTGFHDLDKVLGDGLMPHRLAMIMGVPGSGKTTLANQIAEHIATTGRPVVYVTLEDTPEALMQKTLARLADQDYSDVQHGRGNHTALKGALHLMQERKSAQRLLYLQRFDSIGTLRGTCREHFARFDAEHAGDTGGGAGLLVVDYLQRAARGLPDATAQDLRLAVSRMTDQLRELARELDCTVLALASQNRAGYNGKGASALASAKESGDIEYGVDVLMALGEASNSDTSTTHLLRQLEIAKNRQGESGGRVELDWFPSRQQFAGVERAKGGKR